MVVVWNQTHNISKIYLYWNHLMQLWRLRSLKIYNLKVWEQWQPNDVSSSLSWKAEEDRCPTSKTIGTEREAFPA